MAKITVVFAVLLIALGLIGFIGTGNAQSTALIPAWIGLALGVGGLLALSPQEGRRKLLMHINVSIGLLGFLGSTGELIRSFLHAQSTGVPLDEIATTAKSALTLLLLLYVALCVRSFIQARRTGKI